MTGRMLGFVFVATALAGCGIETQGLEPPTPERPPPQPFVQKDYSDAERAAALAVWRKEPVWRSEKARDVWGDRYEEFDPVTMLPRACCSPGFIRVIDTHALKFRTLADHVKVLGEPDCEDYSLSLLSRYHKAYRWKGSIAVVSTGEKPPPRMHAVILAVDENSGMVTLSAGKKHGAVRGHIFTVYRDIYYIGRVRVMKTGEKTSVCKVLVKELKEGAKIRKGDEAATNIY